MKRAAAFSIIAYSALILLLVPAAVFLAAALYHGMGVAGGLSALAEQVSQHRNNPLLVAVLGLAPLVIVALVIAIRKWRGRSADGSAAYAWGGCLPVIAVALFVNLQYWPSFLPSRQFMGFPHGLEFVIGPLVFAPIGIVLGLLVVWSLRRGS